MPFESFMRDNISVRKKNGDVIEGLKASVQSTEISLFRPDVLIESGDLIERRASNGAVETFEVIDPGFHEAFHSIGAHYHMSVRKLGLPEAKRLVESITYNITGHNARVNNHSVDQSTNTVNIGAELQEYIDGLREVVNSFADAQQKQNAVEIIDAVEMQLSSAKPSKTVISALLEALPHVGSIAALATAIVSKL